MIEFHEKGYVNGYLERKAGGRYEGILNIEGVEISPICGAYFKEKGVQYLWLKRSPMLEWDEEEQRYTKHISEPRWEAYLKKVNEDTVSYRGDFYFLHLRYSIIGIWDKVFGKDRMRLNLFVERLPLNEQTIINNINERNKHLYNEK